MAYCVKLSGEHLSRYLNKTESVSLRKCLYYDHLTKKVMSEKQTLLRNCNTYGGKIASIDKV